MKKIFIIMVSLIVIGKIGASAIHEAAKDGDIVRLKELFSAGNVINDKDSEGNTALHYASQTDNQKLVAFLLEGGAQPCSTNKVGKTSIQNASEAGSLEILETFANWCCCKSSLFFAQSQNLPPKPEIQSIIQSAVKNYLLSVSPNEGDPQGAALAIQEAIINYADQQSNKYPGGAGAAATKIQALVRGHQTRKGMPLETLKNEAIKGAVLFGNIDKLKSLIQKFDINAALDSQGNTALHYAAMAYAEDYAPEIIQILLDNKADANAVNNFNQTPLDFIPKKFDDYPARSILVNNGAVNQQPVEQVDVDLPIEIIVNVNHGAVLGSQLFQQQYVPAEQMIQIRRQ